MTAPVLVHLTVDCPACGGGGEIVTCVNDGSHGCSHSNDIERTCTLCKGYGACSVESAHSYAEHQDDEPEPS